MSRTKTFLGRLKKKLHPLAVRKWLKYLSSRSEKHIKITSKLSSYINSLLMQSEESKAILLLKEHEKGARSYMHIPYSEGRFLETYVRAMGAKNILEIGTFKGYSTYFLAKGLVGSGKVITIDEDARYVAETENFWGNADVGEKIIFKLGMAEKILREMTLDPKFLGYFDVVFIDADKENYQLYAEYAFKLLRIGGSLLVDNTLWKGLVAYPKPHDNSAMHLRQFNDWIAEKYGKSFALLPGWDGLSIVVKEKV